MNKTKEMDCAESQQRVTDNIEVLKAFKAGDASLVEKYTGWGGLRQAIFNRDIFCQLKFDCGLTDAEIDSIKQSTRSGYFTPVRIVREMWALCQRHMAKAPKRILDPACGSNHFFANMPKAWRQTSELVGVELDSLSAEMARARMGLAAHQGMDGSVVHLPSVDVQQMAFEHYREAQPYQLVIGNPPYGRDSINDKSQPDLMNYCIHHAFALKGFRLLQEGGFLCLLLPSWFLDNGTKHVRDVIAGEHGELIEAIRLPDNQFQNAKVTVDCVLIKKCSPRNNSGEWVDLGRVQVDGRSERINRYFLENPKQVLGKLASVPMYDRYGLTCQYTQDPIVLWQQLGGGYRAVHEEKKAVATMAKTEPVGVSKLDVLIAQIEGEIKTRQRQYRELTALKLQQQTMEATINSLQI